ncbi:MAG TPA: restriction endonuclease [Gemmatimonadales bacterium]|jgi:hypothetical protein
MGAPPDVTPEYFQILVVRELRKVGLDVGEPRVQRRSELPEPQQGFVLELLAPLSRGAWRKRALIACYRQDIPVRQAIVEEFRPRVATAKADFGVIVSTADFEVEAVAAAQQAGIALLQVVDGRKAYDLSGWGSAGHYPAWLPAHALQLVERDPSGAVRLRPLEAGSFEAWC